MKYTLIIALLLVGGLFYWLFGTGGKTASGHNPEVVAAYRDTVLDYAMDNQPANELYEYENAGLKGSVSARAAYQSKSGSTCRSYQEAWSVDGQAFTQEGVACKREGDNGWCRLQRGQALTCALEDGQSAAEIGLRKGTMAVDSLKQGLGF